MAKQKPEPEGAFLAVLLPAGGELEIHYAYHTMAYLQGVPTFKYNEWWNANFTISA